jgi:pimeloyl-ACP methyl ester carboxylesterase
MASEHARRLVVDDGVPIAYRVTPCLDPHAPRRAVVLLHGLASNLTRWSELVEQTALADAWDLIRVDLRGHGDSPTRGGIGLERWCDDLAALLTHEGHAHCVLVGHSLGAQVALHFAARHARSTIGLVLIDPVFRGALHGRWRLLALGAPLIRGAAAAVRALNALGLRRRRIATLDLRALDAQARAALRGTPEATDAFIRHYSSTRADLRSFRSAHYLRELVEMFRPVPDPATIRVPVRLLLSSGATFADPGATRGIAARLPSARIEIVDCQHWPLTERPLEVRRAIEDACAALAAVPVQPHPPARRVRGASTKT